MTKNFEHRPAGIKPTIAACMIVKNEESDLYRCLRHLRPYVDELHIIDTGSTDRTMEIAQQFNPTVLRSVEFDNFSQVRNESLRDVKADWVLWIDADEVLVGGEKIRQYLNTKYFEGYVIPQRHLMMDQPESTDPPTRIFRRRDHYKFRGLVHEHAEDTSRGEFDTPIQPIMVMPDVNLAHYGYISEPLRREKVSNRNMALMIRSLREEPKRQLTHALAMRDYMTVARWYFEKNLKIDLGSNEHKLLCAVVETYLSLFDDEKHPYYRQTYPMYQECLAMMSAMGLPCSGQKHPPFEVAFGMLASAVKGGIPDKKKMEGAARWWPDEKVFMAFVQERCNHLFSVLNPPKIECPEFEPYRPADLLEAAIGSVPRRYLKDGRQLVAVGV